MKHRNVWSLIKGLLFMQLFAIIIVLGLSVDLHQSLLQKAGEINIHPLLLQLKAMPVAEGSAVSLVRENNIMMGGSPDYPRPWGLYLNRQFPRDLMAFNLQALNDEEDDALGAPDDAVEDASPPPMDDLDSSQVNTASTYFKLFTGHVVTLYCTHSGESYVPDSGKTRIEGGPGLITRVAAHLGSTLKQKGMEANFVNTLHDQPDFNKSYTNSRKTVAGVMASEKSSILALFDIHRDSIPGVTQGAKVNIKGRNAAPILIIVGTDERKAHPNWKQNLQFAQKLYQQAAKDYPGLIKGVRTKSGTYNQEYFKGALLLEFGTDYNTLEECFYSSELFADILLKVLKEEI
ncbi:MAG: stage II sporulation protein P [Syntrophomonadaceae bacterium]